MLGPGGGLEVLAPGPLALIQDLGRPGYADLGVTRSGAADRGAFRLGARLVANGDDRAAIEALLGGLRVRAHGNLTLALTGADANAHVRGRAVSGNGPFPLSDQEILTLEIPPHGLRTYLSVRGGLDVPAVLGSRATDTLAGLGPAPLESGVLLPVGRPPARFPHVDQAPVPAAESGPLTLRITLGPRDRWLDDSAELSGAEWTVSERSNRVGIRLQGSRWRYDNEFVGVELPSEGVVRGALQLPPDGEPILFLADHPVTGGYPVVAVVAESDVDRAAQARPGRRIRFVVD